MVLMLVIMLTAIYIVDLSGFVENLRGSVRFKWLDLSHPRWDKPLFCPRCLTFWAGVVLSIGLREWTCFVWGVVFSWAAPYLSAFIDLTQELFIYWIGKVQRKINRNGKSHK